MPARPLSDEALQLIDAVRNALAARADVDERSMFGCYCFFVDGKLCIGVKGDELLLHFASQHPLHGAHGVGIGYAHTLHKAALLPQAL